jgi:hypothetical protein
MIRYTIFADPNVKNDLKVIDFYLQNNNEEFKRFMKLLSNMKNALLTKNLKITKVKRA